MAAIFNHFKGVITIVAICFAGVDSSQKFGDLLTAEDLRHYVRGNHEVEEFDIVYPFGDEKRFKRSLSESILSTASLTLSAFEEDLHLELFENPWLVPTDLKIKHVYETYVHEEIVRGKRCHFHGRSMNHNDSIAVISTCAGVHGLITFDDNEMFIQPLKNDHKSKLACNVTYDMKQPHIIYKRRFKERKVRSWGQAHGKGRKRKDVDGIDFEFYVGPKFMEIKLVLDIAFVEENSPNPIDYALALMNIASRRFVDPSLGFPIYLYLVSVVQLHWPEPFLVSSSLYDTYLSFQVWLNKYRIDDDNDRSHLDHAILLSSHHFDMEINSASGVGSSFPPMCFPHPKGTTCNAVIDLGLGSGFVIAHEIGHSLGLKHDDDVECGTHYIMARQQNEEQSDFTWSSCSKERLNKLWRGKPWCLDDIPDDNVRKVSINEINPAPSVTYQCTEIVQKLAPNYYGTVTGCVAETTCTSLFCELPDSKNVFVDVCTPMGQSPVEGTSCGEHRYCVNGECTSNAKDISSLEMSDGGFSDWETSPCSQSCGGGVKVTRRTCSNPSQEFAGAFCDGQHLLYELCNMQPCPGGNTFLDKRDDQCSSTSPDLSFHIFSGDGAPPICLKACLNNTSLGWGYFEPLYFEDGTQCWDDIFNDDFTLEKRCVAGKCVQFNCFGNEGFKGLYDECRVCGGNGTSCSLRNESILNDKHQRNIILPVGATSVIVVNYDCQTEQGRTALDLQTGSNPLSRRGNVFKVGFDFPNGIRCAVNLTSTGPLKEEHSLPPHYRSEIRTNHSLISVKYFLPKSSSTFLWRPGPFGLCTADCGAGMRQREIQCLEIINGQEHEVADYMCDVLDKPRTTVPCCIPCWSFTFTPCKDDEKGYVYTRLRRAECKIGNKSVDSSKCNPATKPVEVYMPCSGGRQWLKYKWTVGPWSSCFGCQRTREVACVVGPDEFPVSDNLCNTVERPNQSEQCPSTSCGRFSTPSPRTTYSWHTQSWSLCRSCDKRYRSVECVDDLSGDVVHDDMCYSLQRPDDSESCSDDPLCSYEGYHWSTGPWSPCNMCRRTREVECFDVHSEESVCLEMCDPNLRPAEIGYCEDCEDWISEAWSECSVSCGTGFKTRHVYCSFPGNARCYINKPQETKACDLSPCDVKGTGSPDEIGDCEDCEDWISEAWSECSVSCGTGFQTRHVYCSFPGNARCYINKPQETKACDLSTCDVKSTGSPDEIGDCEDCADWISEAWSECSVSCGTGFQTRHVYCSFPGNARCYINKPQETKACDLSTCDVKSTERFIRFPSVVIIAILAVVALPCSFWRIACLRRKLKKLQSPRRSRLREDNIEEAESVRFEPISALSGGSVMALHTFRDSDGIVLHLQIKDLPNCFQKSTVNPEETLSDEFMKLKQSEGSTIFRGRSSETRRNQESTEFHQYEMITQLDNRSPCYIKSKGKFVLIVTEGPNPSTLETFWKLIWQEKVPIIVNLTENKGSETRHVTICHFFLWPETGIPNQPEGLIGFIKKLRSLYQGHSAPILVHCNKDLRSSSAFATIFCLVEHLKSRQPINVHDFVRNLRDIDQDLTPNQAQYNFIYEALAAASLFPQVDLQPHTLFSMDFNNNIHLRKLIREYEGLMKQQMFGTPAVSAEGCKPNNAAKNRYPDIIPLDRYRPVWTFYNENASSYINATLVDSFWRYNGIITTQCPLPNTIEDFWSIIYYYKCSAVVSLNSFSRRNENAPEYWLEDFTAKYGKNVVECARLSHWKSGVFSKRKMCVRREGYSTRLNIDHYHLPSWPTSNSNLSGLLDIIAAIQPMLKAKKRIALHCMDGSSRSGIIAAVSTELGRVMEDGVVDLFQTAVKLRRRNPRFIKCQEEYNFSYTLLQAALKAWRAEF